MSDQNTPPPGEDAPGTPPPPAGATPPPGSYPPPPPPPPPPAGGPYPYPPPYPPPTGATQPPAGAYPPPGGYSPAPTGPAPFSVTEAFTYGWQGFTRNIGPLAIIALVVIAAQLVTQVLQRLFDNWVLDLSANLVGAFISLVISLGLIRAALIIIDGGRPKVEDVVSTDGIGSYIVASLLVAAIVTVGLVLCIVPGLIAGFLLQFFGYAIVDRRVDATTTAPNSDPIGALRASFAVTSANAVPLILLALLALAANFVGALLCGVGLLVTIPVTAIAVAYAWRFFTAGRIAVLA